MNCWGLSVDKCDSKNLQGNPVVGKPLCFCEFYSQELYQILTVCTQGEKIPLLARGEDKEPFWNMPDHSVLNKACPLEKTILPEPNLLGKDFEGY